jgi:subtilisin family serine protease
MPGTAKNAITVGAWVSKKVWRSFDNVDLEISGLTVGAAASFSNPGPSRDGRVKPEVCAPGQMIGSTYSADAPPNGANSIWKGTTQFPNAYILRDNRHAIGNGTSFAAPLVAGGVALMLQSNPMFDAAQIRNALTATADADNFTGTVPNNKWGYGKVDLNAAFAYVTSVREPQADEHFPNEFALRPSFPNPFSQNNGERTTFIFHMPRAGHVEIAVFDLLGRKVRTLLNREVAAAKYELTWDGHDEAGSAVRAGVYFYRARAGKFSQARKLVLLP